MASSQTPHGQRAAGREHWPVPRGQCGLTSRSQAELDTVGQRLRNVSCGERLQTRTLSPSLGLCALLDLSLLSFWGGFPVPPSPPASPPVHLPPTAQRPPGLLHWKCAHLKKNSPPTCCFQVDQTLEGSAASPTRCSARAPRPKRGSSIQFQFSREIKQWIKQEGTEHTPLPEGPDTQQVGVREFMYNAESPSPCLFWGPKLSCLQSPGRQYT